MNRLRPIFITMRAPALADRRGLRWMLSDRLWPAQMVVLKHRGRRSGKLYSTPVEALQEDRERGQLVISPLRGTETDWYRNIIAGGLAGISLRGETYEGEWREMSVEERKGALVRYADDHPLYSRVVFRGLMGLNELSGEPIEALGEELPMLSVQLSPKGV